MEKDPFPPSALRLSPLDLAQAVPGVQNEGFRNPKLPLETCRDFVEMLGLPELPASGLVGYFVEPAVDDPSGEVAREVLSTLKGYLKWKARKGRGGEGEWKMPELVRARILVHVQIY